MRRRSYLYWLRHPRTLQEIKANLDKYDPLVRPARRRLPTAWDDQFVHRQKSWKYLGRKHQYREKGDFSWHEFKYSAIEWRIVRKLTSKIQNMGYYFEYTRGGIMWYGPELL